MFKFSDLVFKDHPYAFGIQAKYKGWSVIKCIGSKGFAFNQYEVQDPHGSIHGYLSEEQVEMLIAVHENKDFLDDEMPF